MSQHDYVINNDSGATVRADINSVLQAILSQNSGSSEPTSTAAGMLWLDTSGGAPYTLKVRDAGNNHWLSMGIIDDPGSDKNMELPQIGAVTGMVTAFAMSSIPSGWLACDGSAVSRTTYANLFGIIATTWGAGDGTTTFNVPDLRGAFLRGTGTAGVSSDYVGPTNVGDYQDDQNAEHNHSASSSSSLSISSDGNHRHSFQMGTGSGPHPLHAQDGRSTGYTNYGGSHAHGGSVSTSTSIGNSGSTEARVYNRGVQYCIKF